MRIPNIVTNVFKLARPNNIKGAICRPSIQKGLSKFVTSTVSKGFVPEVASHQPPGGGGKFKDLFLKIDKALCENSSKEVKEFVSYIEENASELEAEEVSGIINSIQKTFGSKISSLIETFGSEVLIKEYIANAIRAKKYGYSSVIRENVLFNPFRLSLEEVYRLRLEIEMENTPGILEILQNNDSKLLKALGSSEYFYNDAAAKEIHSLSLKIKELLRKNYPGLMQSSSRVDIGEINGARKFITAFKLPVIMDKLKAGRKINYESLIESNLLTTDSLGILKELKIQLPKTLKSTYLIPGQGSKKILLSTEEILNKVEKYGFASLSSHEQHALTDELVNIYRTNPQFAGELAKRLGSKASDIYRHVDSLKESALNILNKGGNVKFDIEDHCIMRMLDRDIVSTFDMQAQKMVSYEEMIERIKQAILNTKLPDGGSELVIKEFGASGIKVKVNKLSPTKVVIDTIMKL